MVCISLTRLSTLLRSASYGSTVCFKESVGMLVTFRPVFFSGAVMIISSLCIRVFERGAARFQKAGRPFIIN